MRVNVLVVFNTKACFILSFSPPRVHVLLSMFFLPVSDCTHCKVAELGTTNLVTTILGTTRPGAIPLIGNTIPLIVNAITLIGNAITLNGNAGVGWGEAVSN